jgi:Tfp pilus assembly protein PilO
MRTHNNSRLPNLALIGLLVAVALLAYSYWNASMKNANLSLELEENIAKLKSEHTKRTDLAKRLDAMDQKLKEYISDLDKEKLHLKTTEKEHDLCRADLSNAQHEYELAKSDASVCQNKMV